ncbi:MAG: hypothetical protein C9356_16465 [Oleiphilus sp.]|nr:MAG: hypothetical protein C9356_16465 [Oleiphilus sp.]
MILTVCRCLLSLGFDCLAYLLWKMTRNSNVQAVQYDSVGFRTGSGPGIQRGF